MKKSSSSKKEISKKTVGAKGPAFQKGTSPEPISDAELHARLAVELAAGPMRYGELRERFDISPLRLQFAAIERFPEAYVKGSDEKGRPTIALRPDRPALEVMLDRAPLIAWVAESGPNGIYLASLHKHTGLPSARIEQLLGELEGIEKVVRNGRVMFKAIPNAVLGAAPRKTPTDPAVLRDALIRLCGDSKRHLSWLELTMERAEILSVLTEFPDDFESEDLGAGERLIWVREPQKPLAATTRQHNRAVEEVRPEVQGPLLEQIFTPEQLRELKHRPHSPGMGTRRQRQPSVQL